MRSFNFADPDEYVGGTPYEALATIRKERPFAWHETDVEGGSGFWLATKHRDVVALSKKAKQLATHAPLLADPLPRELWGRFPSLAMIANNLLTFDHEKHRIFRTVANPFFAGPAIGEWESAVEAECMGVVRSMSRRATFDFAADVALAIAVQVVLGVFLGVPNEDLERVSRCILTINAMDDPLLRPRRDSLLTAAEDLYAYGMALLRRTMRMEGHGLLGRLLTQSASVGLSAEEMFLVYWFPLAGGAFDTTASTIAGGAKALLDFPDERQRLSDDPTLIPSAVEEMLRWVSPVIYFRRTAVVDVEFGGQLIQRGQKVLLCYASANRDEEVFERPDNFDVSRQPNPHVAFGYGPHFCLGSGLATVILRVFLREFLRSMPQIRLSGAVIRTRSAWMNRIRTMSVVNPTSRDANGHVSLPLSTDESRNPLSG